MFRRRYLILPLTLFVSVFAFLNAPGFCLSGNEVAAKSATHIPGSIHCLDKEEELFLSEVYQGHKNFYFSKVGKRASIAYDLDFSHAGAACPAVTQISGTIFAPRSIPIHQFNTVYRI